MSLFSPPVREPAGTRHQFDRPFVAGSGAHEAALAVRAGPVEEQVKATADRWRERRWRRVRRAARLPNMG